MKTCSKCGAKYQATAEYFYPDKRHKDKLQSACKKCCCADKKGYYQTEKGKVVHKRAGKKYQQSTKGKNYHKKYERTDKGKRLKMKGRLKRNFGLTIEQYDKLFEAQNGVCAICNGINPDGRRLAVDHDHKTGKIRALLCLRCNVILGMVKENKERILGFILYLEKHDVNN
jgi:hypothetical protein